MNNPCWLLGLVCDCFQGKNLKALTEAPMQMEGQATPSQGFNQLGKVEQVTSEDFNWASTNAKIRKPPFFWIPRLFWIGFKRLLTDDIIERAVPIQQKKWGADIWNNESIYIFTTTHVAFNKKKFSTGPHSPCWNQSLLFRFQLLKVPQDFVRLPPVSWGELNFKTGNLLISWKLASNRLLATGYCRLSQDI